MNTSKSSTVEPIHPWWDDHEFANDPEIGGADNHTADDEDWSERVEAALQAYAEWMPTRLRERNQIYRAFDFGGLARLVILDRQRRYLWPEDDDEGYLGTAQSAWLQQVIADTTASWLIFGQGTTFGPRDADGVSRSSWDAASRDDVLAAVAEAGLEELVVLTGDIHKFDALDVVADPTSYDPETGEGSAAVEFAVGSVSSPGSTSSFESVPQHFWSDGDHRGYCVVDVTPDEVQVDFFGFEDLLKIGPVGPEETHLKSYVVQRGSHHAVEVFAPLASREDQRRHPDPAYMGHVVAASARRAAVHRGDTAHDLPELGLVHQLGREHVLLDLFGTLGAHGDRGDTGLGCDTQPMATAEVGARSFMCDLAEIGGESLRMEEAPSKRSSRLRMSVSGKVGGWRNLPVRRPRQSGS